MKRILITGANSYIGESVRDYLLLSPEEYQVKIIDTIGWEPIATDFVGYDVVFNVAGIAHIKETKENRHLYYDINRDLVIRIAEAAKEADGEVSFANVVTFNMDEYLGLPREHDQSYCAGCILSAGTEECSCKEQTRCTE